MPRWEFHLSVDETDTAARWAWMYRLEGGDTITSKRTFATYRDCIGDALLHGYHSGEFRQFREQPLRASG